MKRVFLFITGCLTVFSISAQMGSLCSVIITVNGNKNRQVLLDGRNYSNEISVPNDPATFTIPDVPEGQHTLQVLRTYHNYNSGASKSATTFTLRPGYDMLITINSDGSIELKENQKWKRSHHDNNQSINPMPDASFNALYQDVQKQWPGSVKMNTLTNAFANPNNYFTTNQVRQLIQLVSSESNRLQLAKSSYRSITDPANFTRLYDLFNSDASRNELDDYIHSYNNNNQQDRNNRDNRDNRDDGQNPVPMTDSRFNQLYQSVQQQWPGTAKMSALSAEFAKRDNYFTTDQAHQLIQLVSSESNRLQLAKSSYRCITDPDNFGQLYDLFNNQASRDELADYVNAYNYDEGPNDNGAPTPMPDDRFNALYQDIQHQWLGTAKMNALSRTFSNTDNYFTVSQVRELIQLVSSENSRLQLAKASYPCITDPDNVSQLYDLFYNQADRDELTAYVNGNNGTNPVPTPTSPLPMPYPNFNALYGEVQQQWLPGAKMTFLTSIFANKNNYFTVSQARQLIQLLSNEMNRLQLAKSSYSHIVDPENFGRIYDLFIIQANRDELANFVNAYPRR